MTILDEARNKLALANRILAHEGVLDGFGHVSLRHPKDPGRYLLARSRSPELIEPSDILEFMLDSKPLLPPSGFLYGERVIHGSIYQSRPDVHAVCHHHSRAVMPFCISGVPLLPVDHLGATMGAVIPFWDQRDEFGDTDLIVAKPEEGQSLARALGANWVVLMRRHGATVSAFPWKRWFSVPCFLAAMRRCNARHKRSVALASLRRSRSRRRAPSTWSPAPSPGHGNTGRAGCARPKRRDPKSSERKLRIHG